MAEPTLRTARPPLNAISTLVAAACTPLVLPAAAQQAPEEIEEIVITSSMLPQPRRQIGTAVSVVDAAEIELRGYDSLADLLRTQTGVGVSTAGGAGKTTAVRIRGEEAYRTQLIIDGVKALDPSAPQVAPAFDSLLTTSDLQRVEILRGPQGFMYGADAGGVINVMTKRGKDEFEGQIGLEYGRYATRRLDVAVSGGSDAGDYYVSVADFDTDGFNSRTTDTDLRDDDGAENTTLHAKLGWNATENLRLQLVAREIDAESAYDVCYTADFTQVEDCRSTTDQRTYKVSAEYSVGKFTNTFGYSNIDIVRHDFTENTRQFGSDGSLNRIEYTGAFKHSDAMAFVYGLDLQDEKLVSDEGPDSRGQNGYYAEYQGAFGEAFYLSLGARYDDNDDFGSHTSTRLTGAYVQDLSAERSLKYRVSVGTGFRAPSLYEIAYNAGPFSYPPASNVVLKEENSSGYDVGIEYDVGNGLHFEVTYFDQDIEDEIFFDLDAFSGYLQSTGKSRSKGVEIGARAPFGERVELIANWLNNDTEDSANAQRVRRPKNQGNFGVLVRDASGRFDFMANYRVARDSIDTDGLPLDDYEVLDLAASFDLRDNLEIFGRIENATDEIYEEIRAYRTARRSLHAGVRLRF